MSRTFWRHFVATVVVAYLAGLSVVGPVNGAEESFQMLAPHEIGFCRNLVRGHSERNEVKRRISIQTQNHVLSLAEG